MNAHPQIPKADTDTISEFLYMLFAPDFVHAFPDAWIEIVCIAPDKKLTWRFFSAHDLKPIIEYVVKMNAAGWNCYVGAALRHGEKPAEGERAKKKHLCAASHFWADCDAQGCYERAADILKRAQINPAMVHITGTTPNTRAQIWIKSAQPIASIAELEAATTALRDAFGSDNVQNADRIMRIAGTVNFPPPHKTEKGYSVELTKLQIDRNVFFLFRGEHFASCIRPLKAHTKIALRTLWITTGGLITAAAWTRSANSLRASALGIGTFPCATLSRSWLASNYPTPSSEQSARLIVLAVTMTLTSRS